MIAIVTDSSSYLTQAEATALGVVMVPMSYSLGRAVYPEAFVDRERRFEHIGLCSINLERNINYGLYRLDYAHHHLFFVNLGKSDIYIEYMSTHILLRDCFLQDIIHVAFLKRCFQPLLAGRIDPFSNNHRFVADLNAAAIRRNHSPVFLYRWDHRKVSAA